MNSKSLQHAAIAAILAATALSGCKKPAEPVPPPATTDVAPPPASTPAPVATTPSVTRIDLGNAVGGDMKVLVPMSAFGKSDTIIAAVSTHTGATGVPGALGAKWTYQDGQVVNNEIQNLTLAGDGVTDFKISKPGGFPAGNYKVEISLDGVAVLSKDFSVK